MLGKEKEGRQEVQEDEGERDTAIKRQEGRRRRGVRQWTDNDKQIMETREGG